MSLGVYQLAPLFYAMDATGFPKIGTVVALGRRLLSTVREMSVSYEVLQVSVPVGSLSRPADMFLGDLVGSETPAMLELCQVAKEVAQSDISVLILGESGTGKEVLAREIFRHSSRTDKPLLKIRCGRLSQRDPDNGSPTPEFDFGVSGPGTLLLDGVEELPPDSQRSLLHLVDGDGLSAGVGADNAAVLPWRLISTSSVELDSEIRECRFRADLYYRLNGVCLRIPPLRERKEDIKPLAKFFAERFSHAFGRERPKRLSRASLKVLGNHQWPGNIRELQNVIQRIVLLDDEEKVLKDLSHTSSAVGQLAGAPGDGERTLSLKRASRLAARRVEEKLILEVLNQTHWNRKQTARELDISYKALLYKLKQLGLDR